jgi:hypothetical protein
MLKGINAWADLEFAVEVIPQRQFAVEVMPETGSAEGLVSSTQGDISQARDRNNEAHVRPPLDGTP